MSATAVVVVHGVVPQPPYGMQDQCAKTLASKLGPKWVYDVWEPPNATGSST